MATGPLSWTHVIPSVWLCRNVRWPCAPGQRGDEVRRRRLRLARIGGDPRLGAVLREAAQLLALVDPGEHRGHGVVQPVVRAVVARDVLARDVEDHDRALGAGLARVDEALGQRVVPAERPVVVAGGRSREVRSQVPRDRPERRVGDRAERHLEDQDAALGVLRVMASLGLDDLELPADPVGVGGQRERHRAGDRHVLEHAVAPHRELGRGGEVGAAVGGTRPRLPRGQGRAVLAHADVRRRGELLLQPRDGLLVRARAGHAVQAVAHVPGAELAELLGRDRVGGRRRRARRTAPTLPAGSAASAAVSIAIASATRPFEDMRVS